MGFIIGFIGGMVGLVLGAVRFPVVMTVETSLSITAGTNLGISTLGAISAALRHYRQRNVEFHAFLFLGMTGAAGAFIGSFFTGHVPVALLLILIGLIVLYESVSLLKPSGLRRKREIKVNYLKEDRPSASDRIPFPSKNRLVFLELLIGFGIGLLGGLVGLILGSIRMPAMISILKMEPKVAVGTNLAVASVMGISGLIGHIINNNLDYIVLITMGAAAMMGGYLGARYTNRFSEKSLKHLIGIVLIVVALTMFLRAFELL